MNLTVKEKTFSKIVCFSLYFHLRLYFRMARITIDSENNSRNILSILKSRIDEGGIFIFRFVQPLPRNRRSLIALILRKGETVSGCEHHNQNSSRYLRTLARTKLPNLSDEWRTTLRILLFSGKSSSRSIAIVKTYRIDGN